jgi:hypothetical protein
MSTKETTRKGILALIWLVAGIGGCTSYDGPFEPVSGTEVPAVLAEGLVSRHATISELFTACGPPSARLPTQGGGEIISYVSIRSRVSFERTLGIRHSESKQTVTETRKFEIENEHVVGTRVELATVTGA